MADRVDNGADIIDSRDVIERIAELEDIEDRDTEQDDELTALKALAEDASGSPDWKHGEVLIRDSYFVRYAQDLADDIGAINKDLSWPNNCIDWDRAARELQYDYFSVEFDGVTYWIRAS